MGPTTREPSLVRARNKRSTTVIPVPEIQQYGVFTPGYSGYLQASALDRGPGSSSAERFGNIAALKYNSDAEQQAYANMLGKAQQLQIDAQKRDIFAEAKGDEAERRIDYLKEGAPIDIENITQDASGETQYGLDPDKTNLTNATGMSGRIADIYKTNADTLKTMTEGTGFRPTVEGMGHFFPDFATGNPLELVPGVAPATEVEANKVETAAQRFARESFIEQLKANASANEVQIKSVLNETKDQILYEITGKSAAAVERAKAEARAGGLAVKGDPPPATASPNAGAQGGGASATPAAAAPRGNLHSYKDAGYDDIESKLEEKYRLPKGLMKRIRWYGEGSNADQVSPTGARTVYQILPRTRQLFHKKYGVDGWASPQSAAEVSALHIRESLDRGEDPVRGYWAGPKGTPRYNSKDADAYVAKVNAGPAFEATRPNQPQADDVRLTKWKSNPLVADAKRNADGSVTVTTKRGQVLTYLNGKRQG